jgi:hypothetical protein
MAIGKPNPKNKFRRFAEGGDTFSPEQEKWLGGADRTDPYILARMRKAVPDQAPVEDRKATPVRQIKDEEGMDTLVEKVRNKPDYEDITKEPGYASNALPTQALVASSGKKGTGAGRGSQGGPTADELSVASSGKKGTGAGRGGQGGPTADELDRYAADQKEAGKRGADLIPTGGHANVSGGKRVEDSSELGRNVSNTLYALGPTRLAGFGNAALEGAIARLAKAAAERIGGKTMIKGRSIKDILKDDTLDEFGRAMKRGGKVKKMASGGSVSSRGDGIAQRGKTRGKYL